MNFQGDFDIHGIFEQISSEQSRFEGKNKILHVPLQACKVFKEPVPLLKDDIIHNYIVSQLC